MIIFFQIPIPEFHQSVLWSLIVCSVNNNDYAVCDELILIKTLTVRGGDWIARS